MKSIRFCSMQIPEKCFQLSLKPLSWGIDAIDIIFASSKSQIAQWIAASDDPLSIYDKFAHKHRKRNAGGGGSSHYALTEIT